MNISLDSIRFLASRKLAVYLLTAVALIAAATQMPFLQEKGLARTIFFSWWYNGLLLLLLLNALICSLFRFKDMGKHAVISKQPIKYPDYRFVSNKDGSHLVYSLKYQLQREKYKIFEVQQNGFLACQGNSYYWGSMIFHLSFIIILIGVMMNNLLGFHGTMIIPEQQIVNEDHNFYTSIKEGILFNEQHQHFQIGAENINVLFDRGKTTASVLESKVWLMEGHNRVLANQTVKPNDPIRFRGRRILLTGYGYSPYFTLEHKGRVIFQNHVNLMTALTKKGDIQYKDSFFIPNSEIKVGVELFPHASITADGKLININNNLELPAVEIKITQREKQLFAGIALMGQTMKLSNGMKLNFLEVKRYGWFDITYQPGVYFVYSGFVLGLVGLVFALFVTPKKIWVSMGESGVEITGCSKRYRQHFHEEFNGLMALIGQDEAVKDEIPDDL